MFTFLARLILRPILVKIICISSNNQNIIVSSQQIHLKCCSQRQQNSERFMDSLAALKTCLKVSRDNIIHDLFEIYNTNNKAGIVAVRFTEEDAYREGVTREVY